MGFDPACEEADASRLALCDGRLGTRGTPLGRHAAAEPLVLAEGLYEGEGPDTTLAAGPAWNTLPFELAQLRALRRTLDLRAGVLEVAAETTDGAIRAVLLSSLARPGVVVLRVEGTPSLLAGAATLRAPEGVTVEEGVEDDAVWMRVRAGAGGLVAAAVDELRRGEDAWRLERIAAYVARRDELPDAAAAVAQLREAREAGPAVLEDEHRAAWAARWEAAEIAIPGDEELQLASRFALYHLLGHAAGDGELALGANGLTGRKYRGHVLWDTDAFVAPVLAATYPAGARATLEYRLRRLDAARRHARAHGGRGARFPWESGPAGTELAPSTAYEDGERKEIRTGEQEEHVTADVVWSAWTYAAWTGDAELLTGRGGELCREAARYWAWRIRTDGAGAGHIERVMGPDEYHVAVDDNAFTNAVAGWVLEQAAALEGTPADEAASWRAHAASLVDGYDEATGVYEQFRGYAELEPVVIAELARERPARGDELLGVERAQRAQVLKQADVLMLHHLLPSVARPGSLEANLDHYLPRTAHGSSLSPGVHAALLFRAGRLDEAVELLRLTTRFDLGDASGGPSGGVHLAGLASVWHALVLGAAGVAPAGRALAVDPHVPPAWGELSLSLRYRGSRVRLRLAPDAVEASFDPPGALTVRGTEPVEIGPEPRRLGLAHDLP